MAAVAVPLDAMGRGDVEGGSEEAAGGSPWCGDCTVWILVALYIACALHLLNNILHSTNGQWLERSHSAELRDDGPQDVVLYFGIIDILQEFNTRKMLESGLRRTLHSAHEISAVGPGRYARRFMDYMHKVFA